MDLTRCVVALSLLIGLASQAAAQTVTERRVREAIEDAARGVGQALGGGSPLTGPAAPTGGLGRLSAGLSLTVTSVESEDPRRASGQLDFQVPVAAASAALGLVGGAAGAGGVDLLGRAGLVAAGDDYETVATALALGFRVGLVPGEGVLPDVSVSLYRTWVDGLEYGDMDADEVAFSADVAAWSARLDASKRFVLVTPYAGIGLDRTGIDGRYRIPADRSTGGQEIEGGIDASSTHGKVYAGVELDLLAIVAAAEVGGYDGGVFVAFGLRFAR